MPRPRKTEREKKQDISIKADPALVARVESLAAALDMPISLIGRKFVARGLAAYERDGLLDEPAPKIKPGVHYNQIIDARSVPGGAKPARAAKTFEMLEGHLDIDQKQPITPKKREKVS